MNIKKMSAGRVFSAAAVIKEAQDETLRLDGDLRGIDPRFGRPERGGLVSHHHEGGRGPSSLWLHDPNAVFRQLDLNPGDAFLDLGCGPGDYTLEAARRVGPAGRVYALDKSALMVRRLRETAETEGLANVEASVADITGRLPIDDGCIDRCLICTVLHVFGQTGIGKVAYGEIRRVLKPDGRLAVIELKREERPFGPPLERRLAPQVVEAAVGRCGFERFGMVEFEYTYLLQFRPAPEWNIRIETREPESIRP